MADAVERPLMEGVGSPTTESAATHGLSHEATARNTALGNAPRAARGQRLPWAWEAPTQCLPNLEAPCVRRSSARRNAARGAQRRA